MDAPKTSFVHLYVHKPCYVQNTGRLLDSPIDQQYLFYILDVKYLTFI